MADASPFIDRVSIFQVQNVDGKTIGNTSMFDSVSTGWYFLWASFWSNNAGGVVTPPTVSIGTNSPNFNDIMPAASLTGLTGSNLTLTIPIITAAIRSPFAAGTTITLRVSVAATATSFNFDTVLVGLVGVP